MNHATRRLGAVIALSTAGLSTACSSSATTAVSQGTPTTAGPTVVTVDMKEWELTPSAKAVKPGAATFTAKNSGTVVHELVLFKTDLDPAKLPLDEEGAVDERAAGVELVDEVEDVAPGQSKSFTVANLAAGKYLLVCNLVDQGEKHFEHKMYVPFTVS